MRDVVDRIMDRVVILSETGCFVFMGNSLKGGYGRIEANGKPHLTHRVMYERSKGPIPEGFQIDHICRVTACCNPDHLRVVTPKANMANARWAKTTHCPNGHEYTAANTRIGERKDRAGSGHFFRMCRTCSKEREQAAYHARRSQNAWRE